MRTGELARDQAEQAVRRSVRHHRSEAGEAQPREGRLDLCHVRMRAEPSRQAQLARLSGWCVARATHRGDVECAGQLPDEPCALEPDQH